jgi:hypothetical protein
MGGFADELTLLKECVGSDELREMEANHALTVSGMQQCGDIVSFNGDFFYERIKCFCHSPFGAERVKGLLTSN